MKATKEQILRAFLEAREAEKAAKARKQKLAAELAAELGIETGKISGREYRTHEAATFELDGGKVTVSAKRTAKLDTAKVKRLLTKDQIKRCEKLGFSRTMTITGRK